MSSKQIVLITGANGGLGFETAKALFESSKAYHILVGVRGKTSRADDTIAALKKAVPNSTSTAEGLAIDITSDESIKKAFEEVQSRFPHLDVLINNAGTLHPPRFTIRKPILITHKK